ncbi:MAG: pilus assembly protein PilM [Planctomycetes bacterium]|nr:pilus assembly protein PilM [Planctomycetota bacterium]
MIHLLPRKRYSPIGVDIGTKSVKLVQLTADRSRVIEHVRWELPVDPDGAEPSSESYVEAITRAREDREFRGNEAVLCLSDRHLFLQNVRIPKAEAGEMDLLVAREAAGRLPFGVEEAEIRHVEAADVRQGDIVLREVIVMACQRSVLDEALSILERAELRPVAVDVEPAALVRSCERQFRRDNDRDQRTMLVHVGHSRTAVVIAQCEHILFVKYIDAGGLQMDMAVARYLDMTLPEAIALRRHNGDRRIDQQDPEVGRSITEAIRPVTERLCAQLSQCVRYHSVTFRGKPLVRLMLSGGEATPQLLETIASRMNMKCELTDSMRNMSPSTPGDRNGQWDVALGLALREVT